MSPVLRRPMAAFPLAAASLVGLALAGCGGEPAAGSGSRAGQTVVSRQGPGAEAARSAAEIIADAQRAARGVTTFRVTGAMHQGKLSFGVDMRYAGRAGAYGTISYGGMLFNVVRIGPVLYFKAPAAFYARVGTPGAAAKTMDGKWIRTATDNAGFASFANFTSGPQFFAGILGSAAAAAMVKVPGIRAVDGTPVVALRNPLDGSLLCIALQGPPLPVEIVGPRGRGSMRVTGYGGPVSLAAPPGATDLTG